MKSLAGVLLFVAVVVQADNHVGRLLYEQGVDEGRQPVSATVNGLPAPSALPCANCHRASGLGTSESGKTIPPVAWRLLSDPRRGRDGYGYFRHLEPSPAPYTPALFHRAVTRGVDSSGNAMSDTMPRYDLSVAQTSALIEYLKMLYPEPQGIDDSELRLAVIIDQRVDKNKRQQHWSFLQGLLAMKNSETRHEVARKRHAPVQRIPQYRAYRKWRLFRWELQGDPESWSRQLDVYYRQTPVFAFLVPLVSDQYERVADFCEQRGIPCLFPVGDESDSPGYYGFQYRSFSKRVAEYVQKSKRDKIQPTYALITASSSTTGSRGQSRLQEEYIRRCSRPGQILITVGQQDVAQIERLECPAKRALTVKLIASEDLGYPQFLRLLDIADRRGFCVVSDYATPTRVEQRSLRVTRLADRFGIAEPDTELLSRDLFAFSLISDAVNKMNGVFSRRYLLELIEHMLNSFPNYSFYREIAGAPYQRHAAGSLSEMCGVGA